MVVPPIPESPRCLSPFQGDLFSLHCLDFQAEDRLTPRWHVGQPCGKASCAASLSCAFQAGILGFARHRAQCHACKNAKDIALNNYRELKYGQLVTETFSLRLYFKRLSFQ